MGRVRLRRVWVSCYPPTLLPLSPRTSLPSPRGHVAHTRWGPEGGTWGLSTQSTHPVSSSLRDLLTHGSLYRGSHAACHWFFFMPMLHVSVANHLLFPCLISRERFKKGNCPLPLEVRLMAMCMTMSPLGPWVSSC